MPISNIHSRQIPQSTPFAGQFRRSLQAWLQRFPENFRINPEIIVNSITEAYEKNGDSLRLDAQVNELP